MVDMVPRKTPSPGRRTLAEARPDLVAQLVDPSLARTLAPKSGKKAMWRCDAGHVWEAAVANRTAGNGCPYCANKRVLPGFNDLATTHPAIAAELVGPFAADEVTAGSNKEAEWRCGLGHVWTARVADRTRRGFGCPYCSNKKVLPGFNDLATLRPDLASELADEADGSRFMPGSHATARWRCPHGHEWDASVVNRARHGNGCPVCANQAVVEGVNDLATTHPALAAELVDPRDAASVTAGSGRRLQWRCARGHVWEAAVVNRSRGEGCPYCSNKRVLPGFNDLATTHPDIAAELADPALALSVTAGSKERLRWRCGSGHEWDAAVHHRTGAMSSGCPVCAGEACSRRVSSDMERDFAQLVRSLEGDDAVETSVRTAIWPYELDIVVPAKGIAFEFNGCHWHSEQFGCDRSYHVRKQEMARAEGLRLVYVWDDDWTCRRDAVARSVAAKLGHAGAFGGTVFARDCTASEVGGRRAAEFMDANHVQGRSAATRHFALTAPDGGIVAVLSVRSPDSNGRVSHAPGTWEVRRYATSRHVPGGFSKLLAHAERTLSAEGEDLRRWLSFSDNGWSDGSMYAACGFSLDAELPPDYRYVGAFTGNRRVPKERFQKRRFREDPDLAYEDGMTERELAALNGLHRCWDCGKKRWVKDVKHV